MHTVYRKRVRLGKGLAVSFCLSFWLFPLVSHAFGITPVQLDFGSLLAGTQGTKTFSLVRQEADVQERVELRLTGQATQAVVVPEEVMFPVGATQIDVPVMVDASRLAVGDKVRVEITAILQSLASQTDITILPSLSVAITGSVTDKPTSAFTVRQASVSTARVRQPVPLTLVLQNDGNVPVKPSRVELAFAPWPSQEPEVFEQVLGEALNELPVFGFETQRVDVQTALPAGHYNTFIRVFGDASDEPVYVSDPIFLQIAASPFVQWLSGKSAPPVLAVSLIGALCVSCACLWRTRARRSS
ncbi:hypothetical protein FJZ23_02505 [Candidatus Parcubacteria bacterium]|nr:hypothetical protein [Candidatus Parcubacteria bacterium]